MVMASTVRIAQAADEIITAQSVEWVAEKKRDKDCPLPAMELAQSHILFL
jgi:hypothetical protein